MSSKIRLGIEFVILGELQQLKCCANSVIFFFIWPIRCFGAKYKAEQAGLRVVNASLQRPGA